MSTGKDGTDAFEDVGHSDEARALLPKMLVGTIEDGFVSPCFNS
jgi:cytochrome b involved in lipid metabolism